MVGSDDSDVRPNQSSPTDVDVRREILKIGTGRLEVVQVIGVEVEPIRVGNEAR